MVRANALNSVAQQLVYVNPQTGSDTDGNGSAMNPYATVTGAQAAISDNSATKPYCIFFNGISTESAIAFKPWISICGSGLGSSFIGANLSLDSSWNDSTGAYSSISNISFTTSLSLGISGSTGTGARLTFNNCSMQNIGFSSFRAAIPDTLIFKNSSTGIFQIQDNNGEVYSSSLSSIANANSVSATAARTLRVVGSVITGNVTIGSSSGQAMTVTLSSTRVGGNATTSGSGALIYDADSIPAGTLSGNTTPSPIVNPAIGGTGVNNGTRTITLGGNLTTSGAFNSTFTMTGTTGVTFPTSGTLATTSQIPAGAALTKADDTNVTLTLGGSPTTALVNAASVTAGWTGTLSSARGGTGANNTATTGTILRGNGTNFVPTTATYPATATGTGTVLRADGTNWSATTATFPNTTTANQLLYSSATNTVGGLATAANGTLVTDGSSVPSISSTLPSAVQNNITAVNSAANTLSIGGSTKTFTSGAANIPTFSAITSFSPGIAFGGGTTGITYGSQTGFYRTITYPNGTIEVAVWGLLTLSNKGSSTGNATLTGLPVTAGPNAGSNCVPFIPAGITIASGALPFLQVGTNATTANIDTTNMNGGGFAQVNNTQFSNTASIGFNFTYWNN